MKEFLLMSGGLDSTTLAYHLKKEKSLDFEGIFIDYGQPTATEELLTVKELGDEINVNIRRVDLSTIWRNFEEEGLDPLANRCTETANIYAPLLLAATFVSAAGGSKLYSAFHKTDIEQYPSTVPVLKAQEKVMQAIDSPLTKNFEYALPFIDKTKSEIIQIGQKLNVPLNKTLSCLNINKKTKGHCGECNSCKTRIKYFAIANIEDKTNYLV